MPSKGDIEFGNLVIREKLALKDMVEECLQYQEEVERDGQVTTLDRVMLQKGYLTEPQVYDMNKKQGRRVIFCTSCQMKLNVAGLAVGQKVKCTKCGTINVCPGKIAFQLVEKPKPVGEVVPRDENARPPTVAVPTVPTRMPAIEPPPKPAPPPPPPPAAAPAAPSASNPPKTESDPPKVEDGRGKKFANRRYGKR
jgi:hypothetical protein